MVGKIIVTSKTTFSQNSKKLPQQEQARLKMNICNLAFQAELNHTSHYKKRTASGRYIHFWSNHSLKIKINFITQMKNRIKIAITSTFYK